MLFLHHPEAPRALPEPAVDAIAREAHALAARGVRELILISQDTTFYGRDLGEGAALSRLLRELNEVEGIDWIRLLYLYPTTITDDILDAMADCDKVCKYIDLPLQHAADDVLRRMKRPGTRANYEKLLARIRERVPGVSLRTTFIVGFPGETDAEFDQLCAFVRSVRFDHVGVFTYSHEEGTTRIRSAGRHPGGRQDEAAQHTDGRAKAHRATAAEGRVGTRVEGHGRRTSPDHELVWRGRLQGQAPEIDPVSVFDRCRPGGPEGRGASGGGNRRRPQLRSRSPPSRTGFLIRYGAASSAFADRIPNPLRRGKLACDKLFCS